MALPPVDIRDFPKSTLVTDTGSKVMSDVEQGIRNCINLRSCHWTRQGSLTNEIIQALQTCQVLTELEINGSLDWDVNAAALLKFDSLRRISLIMPTAAVVDLLNPWFERTGEHPRSLTMICKVSFGLLRDVSSRKSISPAR